MAGEYPDVVIGCTGGGSNFGGMAFPFLRKNLLEGRRRVSSPPSRPPRPA
jgi:tryptophan synthase beta chain